MRGTGALYFAAAHPCEPMLAAAKAPEGVRVAGVWDSGGRPPDSRGGFLVEVHAGIWNRKNDQGIPTEFLLPSKLRNGNPLFQRNTGMDRGDQDVVLVPAFPISPSRKKGECNTSIKPNFLLREPLLGIK